MSDDLSPLEDGIDRFVHLIESSPASGGSAYICSIIGQALSHQRIYNGFNELLALSAIQMVCKENPAVQNTLELFAYGTIEDYVSRAESSFYLELNPVQLSKLRRLSVVTLVRNMSLPPNSCGNPQSPTFRSSTISYAVLSRHLHLDVSNDTGRAKYRELERFLTECIYNRILTGGHHKLDQKRMCLHVLPHPNAESYALTRDFNLANIDQMAEQLQFLISHSNSVVQTLKGLMLDSQSQRVRQESMWAAVEQKLHEDDCKQNPEDAAASSGSAFAEFSIGGRRDSRRSKRRYPGAFLGVGGANRS